MPFAAFGTLRLVVAFIILIFVTAVDTGVASRAFLELFLVGRIPGTDTIISFEAFFAGAIFVVWAILTYNFTLTAVSKITDVLKPHTLTAQEIEEVAL